MSNPNNTETIIDDELEECKKDMKHSICREIIQIKSQIMIVNNQYIFVPKKVNGIYKEVIVPYKCQSIRSTLRKLAKSGLKNIIHKYTFENYLTSEKWQADIKNKTIDFANRQNKWFYISG